MKNVMSSIAVSVLAVQATILGGQSTTNSLTPMDNLGAARSHIKQPALFKMATNTPEFEGYAIDLMLKQANEMRENWHLDIPKPLTLNDIFFSLQATAYGFVGGIGTRDSRFNWSFDWSVMTLFQDHQYWPRSFRYRDEESARLSKIKSKIDAAEAETIARNALHGLGLTEKLLHLIEPPRINQYKFEETNGIVYPLPMFNVGWYVEGFIGLSEPDDPRVTFDISGITKNVAEYFNPHTPRVPLPTNYFQILNLPTTIWRHCPRANVADSACRR